MAAELPVVHPKTAKSECIAWTRRYREEPLFLIVFHLAKMIGAIVHGIGRYGPVDPYRLDELTAMKPVQSVVYWVMEIRLRKTLKLHLCSHEEHEVITEYLRVNEHVLDELLAQSKQEYASYC